MIRRMSSWIGLLVALLVLGGTAGMAMGEIGVGVGTEAPSSAPQNSQPACADVKPEVTEVKKTPLVNGKAGGMAKESLPSRATLAGLEVKRTPILKVGLDTFSIREGEISFDDSTIFWVQDPWGEWKSGSLQQLKQLLLPHTEVTVSFVTLTNPDRRLATSVILYPSTLNR